MLIMQHGDVKQKADEDDEEEEEDADVKELMEKMQELIKGQDDLMRGQRKLEELEDRLLKVRLGTATCLQNSKPLGSCDRCVAGCLRTCVR